MILTILTFVAAGALAGLIALHPRWQGAAAGAGVGLVAGTLLAFLNVYVGSIRGILGLVVVALGVGAAAILAPAAGVRRPTRLHFGAGATALAVLAVLVVASLVPLTAWGAGAVDERVYDSLSTSNTDEEPPVLESPDHMRVVPWRVASQLLVRSYGADSSWLDTGASVLAYNTYPDTVNGEFIWVNAPAPEQAKWLFGGRIADKILYVKNDATNLTPTVVEAPLQVNLDAIWWQHRVARHVLNEAELQYVLSDVSLQLDDDHNPHWVAYLAREDLRGQRHLEKLLVIDARTGTDELVDLTDAPEWLEVVYPENYVYDWVSYWGRHREGLLHRLFNAQGLMDPDDATVRYVRLGNGTYWLLPMRQLEAPQLGGYVLVDTRTGEATFHDRFDHALVDYDTARDQLAAIMASGEATQGGGQIRLSIAEGYLYPVRMNDGRIREAYVFPLLEGLKVSRFAIIDAADYTNRRVFAPSVGDALTAYRAGIPGVDVPPPSATTPETRLQVVDGSVQPDRILVNLNGTHYRVTSTHLADGNRTEPAREMDELELAVTRANRGEHVVLDVRIQNGRVIDVTYPGLSWGD